MNAMEVLYGAKAAALAGGPRTYTSRFLAKVARRAAGTARMIQWSVCVNTDTGPVLAITVEGRATDIDVTL